MTPSDKALQLQEEILELIEKEKDHKTKMMLQKAESHVTEAMTILTVVEMHNRKKEPHGSQTA